MPTLFLRWNLGPQFLGSTFALAFSKVKKTFMSHGNAQRVTSAEEDFNGSSKVEGWLESLAWAFSVRTFTNIAGVD